MFVTFHPHKVKLLQAGLQHAVNCQYPDMYTHSSGLFVDKNTCGEQQLALTPQAEQKEIMIPFVGRVVDQAVAALLSKNTTLPIETVRNPAADDDQPETPRSNQISA